MKHEEIARMTSTEDISDVDGEEEPVTSASAAVDLRAFVDANTVLVENIVSGLKPLVNAEGEASLRLGRGLRDAKSEFPMPDARSGARISISEVYDRLGISPGKAQRLMRVVEYVEDLRMDVDWDNGEDVNLQYLASIGVCRLDELRKLPAECVRVQDGNRICVECSFDGECINDDVSNLSFRKIEKIARGMRRDRLTGAPLGDSVQGEVPRATNLGPVNPGAANPAPIATADGIARDNEVTRVGEVFTVIRSASSEAGAPRQRLMYMNCAPLGYVSGPEDCGVREGAPQAFCVVESLTDDAGVSRCVLYWWHCAETEEASPHFSLVSPQADAAVVSRDAA